MPTGSEFPRGSSSKRAVAPIKQELNRDDQRLAELRDLLLGPERENWERLREAALEDQIARCRCRQAYLAGAVKRSPEVDLRQALQPLMEEALKVSKQTHPKMLADALFPHQSRRHSQVNCSTELDAMLESLNWYWNRSSPARSLPQWRWEANALEPRSRTPWKWCCFAACSTT